MYRIIYSQGNGYHCGCCRREWEVDHDVETPEEVVEWLSKLEAGRKMPLFEDGVDREVNEIIEIKQGNLVDKFKADPERVAQIIADRKQNKELAKEKAKQDRIKQKSNKNSRPNYS